MARGAAPKARARVLPGTDAVRFLLRLPPALHRRLVARAEGLGVSLNEHCVRRLSAPELPAALAALAPLMLARAEAVAGPRLIGLVVHGSWSRGDARAGSDVDVLVVIERSVPLTRGLYRVWDEVPVTFEGRTVDAHFIHLPADPRKAGGVWCEAAVEGRVIFDREGQLEAALIGIRRAIADGRLLRKHAHGQPYWTAA